ncbi:hypothetical protein STBA_71540 [Streptomyces sp. MP131-18]|nr:hypothetical protein STBA_71540 [Streptomyces sp. MP131-18]
MSELPPLLRSVLAAITEAMRAEGCTNEQIEGVQQRLTQGSNNGPVHRADRLYSRVRSTRSRWDPSETVAFFREIGDRIHSRDVPQIHQELIDRHPDVQYAARPEWALEMTR